METLQDVLNEIDAIEKQIGDLKEKKKTAINKAISLAPFKKGDKVIVTESGYGEYPEDKETICFIGSAGFKWGNLKKPTYEFNKMKKDGTMARVSAGIYSYKSISLFDEKK